VAQVWAGVYDDSEGTHDTKTQVTNQQAKGEVPREAQDDDLASDKPFLRTNCNLGRADHVMIQLNL
jgi:hypothetical protein